jgi:ClpP class serine protease
MHVTSTPSAMSVPAAAATPSNWKRFLPAPVASLLKKLGASEQIAVVHLTGIIAASGGPGPQAALNLSTVGPQLERAFTTKNVKLVALVINCPGGSPTQSGLLGERIRMLSEKHEIPVVAVVEDLAASGGYWLACAADEIVAHRTSMVGSIGVISAGFWFRGPHRQARDRTPHRDRRRKQGAPRPVFCNLRR